MERVDCLEIILDGCDRRRDAGRFVAIFFRRAGARGGGLGLLECVFSGRVGGGAAKAWIGAHIIVHALYLRQDLLQVGIVGK